jgi:hypothetical protein
VTALRWSPNGERLALAYSDGSATVASVDGHRLWHSRITPSGCCPLERVCWRPDGRVLLLAGGRSVTAHDALSGAAVPGLGQVTLHCCGDGQEGKGPGAVAAVRIAALEWHWSRMLGAGGGGGGGELEPSAATASSSGPAASHQSSQRHALLIVCSNGLLQLMRGEHDDDGAICVDTGLSAPLCASWAPDGATFAVSGLAAAVAVPSASSSSPSSPPSSQARMVPTVQLYTSAGEHLHTFRVDGYGGVGGRAASSGATAAAAAAAVMPIEGLAWEGAGPARARLSLAVGPALLLANVRRPHLWARFGGGRGGRSGGVIAYAASATAAAAGADGGQGEGGGVNEQRIVLADVGALLAALESDRRRCSSKRPTTSGPTPLPRPRVFIKAIPPCSGSSSDGSSTHSTTINMASAGDLCALATCGGAAAGRCRLALLDAAGEAVATQALPAGASARFFAAARWGKGVGFEDNDEDEDIFGEKENEEDDDEEGASAVVAAAGEDGGGVFVWWWRRQRSQQKAKVPSCWAFHVDHLPLGCLSSSSSQQQQQQQRPQRPPLCAAAAVGTSGCAVLAAPVQDHITAIALDRTGTRLLIGRESGVVADYALAWPKEERAVQPTVDLRARHLLRCCPSRLEFNSDCSLVAVIDTTGDLSLLALPPLASSSSAPPALSSSSSSPSSAPAGGKHLAAVRHEVWDVCWSSDEPFKLAATEREQLRVLRCPSLEPEELNGADDDGGNEDDPDRRRRCSRQRAEEQRRWRRGMPHLLEYGSLRVLGIALDSLVAAAAAAGGGDGCSSASSSSSAAAAAIASNATQLLASGRAVFVHETEVLRRARALVARSEASEDKEARGSARSTSSSGRLAAELVALSATRGSNSNKQQQHLHPRLSKLLADHALARGDWATAERALRACGDYGGVLLARRGALLLRAQGNGGGAAEAVVEGEAALLRREFAAAERAYCQADRADLAVAMWQRLSCERHAERLLLLLGSSSSGGGGVGNSGSSSGRSSLAPASADLTTCWYRQARTAAEQRRWSRAGRYLALCLDSGTGAGAVAAERDAVRWLHLTNGGWERLERMATSADRGLPEGSPLLPLLMARLQSAGLLLMATGGGGARGGG